MCTVVALLYISLVVQYYSFLINTANRFDKEYPMLDKKGYLS